MKVSLCLFTSCLVDILILQGIGEALLPTVEQANMSPERRITLEQHFDGGEMCW